MFRKLVRSMRRLVYKAFHRRVQFDIGIPSSVDSVIQDLLDSRGMTMTEFFQDVVKWQLLIHKIQKNGGSIHIRVDSESEIENVI